MSELDGVRNSDGWLGGGIGNTATAGWAEGTARVGWAAAGTTMAGLVAAGAAAAG